MTIRQAVRAAGATLVGTSAAYLASAASAPMALALQRDDGDEPGYQLTLLESLGLYVLAPAALFALITLLVLAPSIARGPRYRPSQGWSGQPEWFGGVGKTGDRLSVASPGTDPGPETLSGGGASARW